MIKIIKATLKKGNSLALLLYQTNLIHYFLMLILFKYSSVNTIGYTKIAISNFNSYLLSFN